MNSTNKRNLVLFLSSLSIVIGLGVGLILSNINSNFYLFYLSLLVALLILFIMIIAVFSGKTSVAKFDLFEPINLLFCFWGIGYVIRSIYYSLGKHERMLGFGVLDGSHYLLLALLLVLLGIISFIFGYKVKIGKTVALHLPVLNNRINFSHLNLVVVLYIIIGIICFWIIIEQSGGISFELGDLSRKRSGSTEYLRTGAYLFFTAAVFRYLSKINGQKTKLVWLHILVASIIPLTTSSRSNLFLWLIILAIIYNYQVRRVPIRLMVLVIPCLLLVSSLLLGFRMVSQGRISELNEYLDLSNSVELVIGGRDFADINTVAHLIRVVPNTLPLQYGKTLYVLITRPIPRAIWPDKPVNLGGYVGVEIYGRPSETSGQLPPSFLGELYWNFHIPGVIIGMFCLGVICKVLYSYLKLHINNPYVPTIYAISIFSILKLINFDLNTGLTSLLTFLLTFGVPFMLVSKK